MVTDWVVTHLGYSLPEPVIRQRNRPAESSEAQQGSGPAQHPSAAPRVVRRAGPRDLRRRGWSRWTVWGAGLIVALGAGVATAHGLYEVALAAGTPKALAWLYPLITDGRALVAYATTARLTNHGRSYAWAVVVIAAGLSGLAQASYLAGGVASAPPALRFAIGAWPAIAAAVVAHLLFLLGTHHQPTTRPDNTADTPQPITAAPAQPTPQALLVSEMAASPLPSAPAAIGPQHLLTDRATPPSAVHPSQRPLGQPLNTPLDSPPPLEQRSEHPPGLSRSPVVRPSAAPAGDRALAVAREHAARHGQLPTVTELATLARVARGTAATRSKNSATNQPSSTPPKPPTTQGPTDEQNPPTRPPTRHQDQQTDDQPEIHTRYTRTRDPLSKTDDEVSTTTSKPTDRIEVRSN